MTCSCLVGWSLRPTLTDCFYSDLIYHARSQRAINVSHNENRITKFIHATLEGNWVIKEHLSPKHVRRGTMRLQQRGTDIFGIADLVEKFYESEVHASFSVQGHVEQKTGIIRLTLALDETLLKSGAPNAEYSVDIMVGCFTDTDKVNGECADKRGISSTFTMCVKVETCLTNRSRGLRFAPPLNSAVRLGYIFQRNIILALPDLRECVIHLKTIGYTYTLHILLYLS